MLTSRMCSGNIRYIDQLMHEYNIKKSGFQYESEKITLQRAIEIVYHLKYG